MDKQIEIKVIQYKNIICAKGDKWKGEAEKNNNKLKINRRQKRHQLI